MTKLTQRSIGDVKFGITLKLGILLAVFGVLASGLTGFYTYHSTRSILVSKETQDILQSTHVLGRRFSVAVDEVAKDILLFSRLSNTHDATGIGQAAETARQNMADQFKSLLLEHPEYSQIRLVSAKHNGIELVRIDRDINTIKVVSRQDLQEKLHYPYVYETIKLAGGKVHYSKIFINREEGAHASLMKPTLQVATPVVVVGEALAVMVINVDLNKIFAQLKADLPGEYQLYLTNQAGDYLIHPDSSKTFGFDYGRRFLIQDTFKEVATIIGNIAESTSMRSASVNQANKSIGGFVRIPFGETAAGSFVIIGMTVPLDFVLAETETLVKDSGRIVIGFSLLAIFLSILVALFFVRPLKRLVVAVQRFAETRELTPVSVHSQDELGMLASSIGQMQVHTLAHLKDLNLRNEDMEHRAQQDALAMAELKRLEELKQEALSRLQEIASLVPGLVYQFRLRQDGSTCFPFASEAIRELFRVSPDEVLKDASKVFDVIHPDDLDALMVSIQASARDMAPWHHEFRTKFDDGTGRWLFGNSLPQHETDGAVLWHGFITDITERKQVAEQLLDSFRQLEEKELAKTRFLAAAGHDLRQPVAAANLFVDALKFTSPTQHQSELIARLDQSMSIFSSMLERLLDISKFDAGLIKPQLALFDLAELFNWLEQNFAQAALDKQLRFLFFFPMGKSLVVRSDIGLLQSVLMNLVTNAIKFTAGGGILISARLRGNNVLLQVWDTGIGIAEANLTQIFDEFYQVGNPQRSREAGLGLGLSICQRAMSLLGGGITCRSRPGRGSVFALSLQLGGERDEIECPPTNITPSEAHNEISFRGKSVVVVEDDALVAAGMVNLLQGLGAEVWYFHNAEEALRHDENDNAHFFIVDYALGGELTGLEFLKKVQQKKQTPIRAVVLTGETSSQFISSVSDSPWPVLHKPINYAKLASGLSH